VVVAPVVRVAGVRHQVPVRKAIIVEVALGELLLVHSNLGQL